MRRRNVFWGIVIILVGGYLLINQIVPGLQLDRFFWPIVLVFIGCWMLLRPFLFKRKLSEENVSIPIEVINQNKYRDLLQARQITLQSLTSQYTGGPVKATLWSQKQPVRGNEKALIIASIVNEGGGEINQVYKFTILIPKDIASSVEIVAQTFKQDPALNAEPKGCGNLGSVSTTTTISDRTYYKIECVHVLPIEPGEYKRVSFFLTPNDPDDRTTKLLIGLANYEYTKTGSTSIVIANSPWH